MAHDVLWLRVPSDYHVKIAVHLEDVRNLDGHEARDAGSRNWASSRRTSSQVVSPLGLARFGGQPIPFCHVGVQSFTSSSGADHTAFGD